MDAPVQPMLPGMIPEGARRKTGLKLTCTWCAHRFEVLRSLRGAQVHCPMCEAVLQVAPAKTKER